MKRVSLVAVIFVAAILLLLQAGAGCQKGDTSKGNDDDVIEARLARLTTSLASARTEDAGAPIARWLLPAELAEVSGLALTPDGRLFTHNDEMARITEIDYKRGTVTKNFTVGQNGLRGDFEGLAYANDRFFLLGSEGTLYEFREGGDGDRVDYTARDTHLGRECEFEGVTYDPASNSMVLACKNAAQSQFKGKLVLFRYRLDSGGISELTVPLKEVIGENGWKQLRPTDIAMDPATGNYVLIAAQEKALVALTPAGEVVFSRPLEGKHPQSEGLTITEDNILIISDESNRTAATITLYRWPQGGS